MLFKWAQLPISQELKVITKSQQLFGWLLTRFLVQSVNQGMTSPVFFQRPGTVKMHQLKYVKLFKELLKMEIISFKQIYPYRIPAMKSFFPRFFLTRSWYPANLSCNFSFFPLELYVIVDAGIRFYCCNELIIREHILSIHYLFKLLIFQLVALYLQSQLILKRVCFYSTFIADYVSPDILIFLCVCFYPSALFVKLVIATYMILSYNFSSLRVAYPSTLSDIPHAA